MVEVKEIKNQNDFDAFVNANNEQIHVIKIGAEWCGPCRQLSTIIQHLEEDKVKDVIFGEVDIESDNVDDILTEYKVRNIPVILFIKDGQLIEKKVGLINANDINNIIELHK